MSRSRTPSMTRTSFSTPASRAPTTASRISRKPLAIAARRGSPMVCANPDLMVMHRGKAEICAGAIAQYYEELGGKVHYFGKPHAPIYRDCLSLLGMCRPSPHPGRRRFAAHRHRRCQCRRHRRAAGAGRHPQGRSGGCRSRSCLPPPGRDAGGGGARLSLVEGLRYYDAAKPPRDLDGEGEEPQLGLACGSAGIRDVAAHGRYRPHQRSVQTAAPGDRGDAAARRLRALHRAGEARVRSGSNGGKSRSTGSSGQWFEHCRYFTRGPLSLLCATLTIAPEGMRLAASNTRSMRRRRICSAGCCWPPAFSRPSSAATASW